jgi:bacteriorhodopsin
VGAIHTVVYQRTAHHPHVTVYDGSSTVRSLPHYILYYRYGYHWTLWRTHPDIVQVGFLCVWSLGAFLRRVSFSYIGSFRCFPDLLSIPSFSLVVSGTRTRLLSHKSAYGPAAGYTVIIWLLYPVCWGLSEGGNAITVDSEMVFYGVLDLFAGPVFLFAFLAALETADYNALLLQSGKASNYADEPSQPRPRPLGEMPRPEKPRPEQAPPAPEARVAGEPSTA